MLVEDDCLSALNEAPVDIELIGIMLGDADSSGLGAAIEEKQGPHFRGPAFPRLCHSTPRTAPSSLPHPNNQ